MIDVTGPGTHAVSSAPSPQTNRSALSEAWYRALYGDERKSGRSPGGAARYGETAAARGSAPQVASGATAAPVTPAGMPRAAARPLTSTRPACEVATLVRRRVDRNAPPSPAARGWRIALARRTLCRFTLPDGARVDVLLQQRGRRLHAVAVLGAGPGARADHGPDEQRIDAALGRARAALLAHGVRLATAHSQEGRT